VVQDWGPFFAELRRELGAPRRGAFFPDSFLQILKIV
jgi:hypothetical protein